MGLETRISLNETIISTNLETMIDWIKPYLQKANSFEDICYCIDSTQLEKANLLIIQDAVSCKQAPILKEMYRKMSDPKSVIFIRTTTYMNSNDNYAVVQELDKIIPIDEYIVGCPVQVETVFNTLKKIQERIQNKTPWEKRTSEIKGFLNAKN